MRLWRSSVGIGLTFDGSRVIKYGIVGQADLSGIISGGRRLEIEVKAARGVQSIAQINFGAMITKFGGTYVVARSVADVEAVL